MNEFAMAGVGYSYLKGAMEEGVHSGKRKTHERTLEIGRKFYDIL